MTTSYNGFKAGDPSIFTPPGLDNSFVPGTHVQLAPGLHRGDIATVLFYVASRLNSVDPAHDQPEGFWGYAYRPSKNDASIISCHASGTAFDWRASAHPNGTAVSKTWTAAQVKQIRAILAEVDGTVHWGGDGWGKGSTIDSMHFEIATGTTMEQLATVAKKISAAPVPQPAPAPSPVYYRGVLGSRVLQNGAQGDDVGKLQSILNDRYPLYSKLACDGIFGDRTEAVVRQFQSRSGLAVDGIVGHATFKALSIPTSF